ncbi:MAG: hypothetical protein EKK45_13465 [Curvibacter sp.]|nr:MAG: hypothetical protein EKK45_13465 [Curvibacter sp.]
MRQGCHAQPAQALAATDHPQVLLPGRAGAGHEAGQQAQQIIHHHMGQAIVQRPFEASRGIEELGGLGGQAQPAIGMRPLAKARRSFQGLGRAREGSRRWTRQGSGGEGGRHHH